MTSQSDSEQVDLRELMKRIIDLHYSSMPDYALDAIFTALIANGWRKLPFGGANTESSRKLAKRERGK